MYSALIVCRIGQKALCTALVEIACVTRIPRASKIDIDSMPYRFDPKRNALTELDMENLRSMPCIS